MSNYRSVALALATCAAGLSVAACTAGITTASSPATSAPAPTRSASVAAAAAASSSRPASTGRTITVNGFVGRFPVPAGAKVAENIAIDRNDIVVIFSSVTPADVSRFYATALPRTGYAVSGNSLITEGGGTVLLIAFSGHGYKGNIGTLSKAPAADASLPGVGTKNVTTISFMRK